MEKNDLSPRENLNSNIKTLSLFSIILTVLIVISTVYSSIQLGRISIPVALIVGIGIFIIVQSVSIRKNIDGDIQTLKKKLVTIFIGTTVCSVLLLLSSSIAVFFFLLPFYSISLLRGIFRFEHGFYDEKRFLDKFLKFFEVVLIIIVVIAGLLNFIYRKVKTDQIKQEVQQEIIKEYWENENKK